MSSYKIIDQTGGAPGQFVIKVSVAAADFADNSEVDLNVDVPSDALVEYAYINVTTAETTATTKTLDVGLLSSESGGDADGFLDGVSVASAVPAIPTLASGGQTLGALLRADESGAGVLVPEPHSTESVTAKSVSATFGDAGGANELVADIYLICRRCTIAG